MAAKKGKGKKKAAGANKAEELRLAQLRTAVSEAEECQRRENERRDREVQEERLELIRDELTRQLNEKERTISELHMRLSTVSASVKDDRVGYESQLEQLAVLRDSLLNEVSLLKAENESRQVLLDQERQNHTIQAVKMRTDLEGQKTSFEEERTKLREQVYSTAQALESIRQECEAVVEEKDANECHYEVKVRGLERELEKALTMNKALQEALESRETDDRKNMALLQMLSVQLDESTRRHEDTLREEEERLARAKEEIAQLGAKCQRLEEEAEVNKAALLEMKLRTESELREYQQQLEQVRFDCQYLNSELESMRVKCAESVEAAETAKQAAETEAKARGSEVEFLQKKVEETESLLYHKEREYYDKVAFLNAQVANNRSAITQLQEKLSEERHSHEAEVQRCTRGTEETLRGLHQLNEAEAARAKERRLHEEKLSVEVSLLKETMASMQENFNAKERALEKTLTDKEDVIVRLTSLLDEHFIPHRHNGEGTVCAEQPLITQSTLTKRVKDLEAELELREQVALETEKWLRARLLEQTETIDALHHDLRQMELAHREEARELEDQVARLTKTLQLYNISTSQ